MAQPEEAPHFLCLDAGTGSGRAAVFDASGRLLACELEEWRYQESLHPNDFSPGYEFHAATFWAVLAGATRRAIERSGIAPSSIAGVAATSQREGSVFLDAEGRELLATPNFDSRGVVEGMEILDRLGGERLYRLTGHVPPFIFPLSRLLWWRRRHPETPVASVLMISDWVTWRLTGEHVAEPSNAGESLFFDIEQQEWSPEILELFEVERSVLPRLVSAGSRVGGVTREAAAATGLLAGTPVFAGGADTQCALLGSGVVDPDQAGAVLGTTTPVQIVLDRPLFDFDRQLWAGSHVVGGRWVLESNAGDTGKAYQWLLDLFGGRPKDDAGYAAIEEQALRANAESPVYCYVGPSVFDLRNMNPSRSAGFLFPYPFGRQRPGPPEFFLGFLESVAFSVRANVEQLEAVTGRKLERLTIGGGMTRGDLVVRLLSEVTGLPLRVSRVPETAALGCALLAGLGAGVYPDVATAVTRAVAWDERPAVDPGPYSTRYRKWRDLYGVLDKTTLP